MKTITTPRRHKQSNAFRNAADPFPIPLNDYILSLDDLINIMGKQKQKKRVWYNHTIKFISFTNQTLILTTTSGTETRTLTIILQPDGLTITCSCASPVTNLCPHAYEYLFNAARLGTEYGFTDFAEGGIIETALAYREGFKIQYTGRHGIRAELTTGLGRIYHLERNKVTTAHLQTFSSLQGNEQNTQTIQGDKQALCYFLMSSPREQHAPFFLPCLGILNKEETGIKSFKAWLNGTETGITSLLSPEHLPRIKACADIAKKSEGVPGFASLDGNAESLALLFRLFSESLPLFRHALLYIHPYYSRKHLGLRPIKTWLHPISLQPGKVSLCFRLHSKGGIHQLTLTILINGSPVDDYRTIASFFVTSGNGTSLYMFASLRDAGIAFWMESNKRLITIFSNHFNHFNRDILLPLRQHYEVRETGKAKHPASSKASHT